MRSVLPLDRDRRSVINELGFRLFKEQWQEKRISEKRTREIAEAVQAYIIRLTRSKDRLLKVPLSNQENTEALKLADSLRRFFLRTKDRSLVFWPEFPGCGILHKCVGDVLQGSKLIEVKAGDRTFRMTDIRQVLTYCSLNFASKRYDLRDIVLVNPRRGVFHQTSVADLIVECSATTAVDFFSSVIEFISAEGNSR
jgi:hypothetical protein